MKKRLIIAKEILDSFKKDIPTAAYLVRMAGWKRGYFGEKIKAKLQGVIKKILPIDEVLENPKDKEKIPGIYFNVPEPKEDEETGETRLFIKRIEEGYLVLYWASMELVDEMIEGIKAKAIRNMEEIKALLEKAEEEIEIEREDRRAKETEIQALKNLLEHEREKNKRMEKDNEELIELIKESDENQKRLEEITSQMEDLINYIKKVVSEAKENEEITTITTGRIPLEVLKYLIEKIKEKKELSQRDMLDSLYLVLDRLKTLEAGIEDIKSELEISGWYKDEEILIGKIEEDKE